MADRDEVIKDAERAVDILGEVKEPTPWCDFIRVSFENALSLLKEQDAVWLDKTDIDEVYLLWECSRCGHKSPDEHRYRYCPHCGARMNVERSERA